MLMLVISLQCYRLWHKRNRREQLRRKKVQSAAECAIRLMKGHKHVEDCPKNQ